MQSGSGLCRLFHGRHPSLELAVEAMGVYEGFDDLACSSRRQGRTKTAKMAKASGRSQCGGPQGCGLGCVGKGWVESVFCNEGAEHEDEQWALLAPGRST